MNKLIDTDEQKQSNRLVFTGLTFFENTVHIFIQEYPKNCEFYGTCQTFGMKV